MRLFVFRHRAVAGRLLSPAFCHSRACGETGSGEVMKRDGRDRELSGPQPLMVRLFDVALSFQGRGGRHEPTAYLKGDDMIDLNRSRSGIFYPHELEWMVQELRKGDKPDEPTDEREERARSIVIRRDRLREAVPDA